MPKPVSCAETIRSEVWKSQVPLELRRRHVRLPSCDPSPLWTKSSPFLYRQWLTFSRRLQVNQISSSDVPPSKCDETKSSSFTPFLLPPPPAATRTSPLGRLEMNEHVSDSKGPGAPPPPALWGRAERSVGQLRLATWVVSLKPTLFVQFEILLTPPVLLLQDVHLLPTSGTQWPGRSLHLTGDHRRQSESLDPESHTGTFNPN